MKKSKMAHLMAEHWFGLFPGEFPEHMGIDEEMFTDVQEKMANLLSFLEHKGMQPPLKKRCPVLHTDTHAWEDEDGN